MIAKLKGNIDLIEQDAVILDVNGVGYHVLCSRRTLDQMPTAGQPAQLWIELTIREDKWTLYGFQNLQERDWFRLLQTVQGVGGKVALAITGLFSPDQLTQVIASQDRTSMTRADGVGPKLATRILTELKDKVGSLSAAGIASSIVVDAGPTQDLSQDAISALTNLGYSRADAFAAVHKALQTHQGAAIDQLIRAGLKELNG